MNWEDSEIMLRQDILNDAKKDYLWSPDALMRMYNRAINEACERAGLLSGYKTIAVTATSASQTLPVEVINITRARLDSTDCELQQATEAQILDKFGSTWTIDEGTPAYYLRNKRAITLYPIPQASDSITYYYTRRPLDSELVANWSDEAPIPEQYHYPLLYWVGKLAYGVRDADTYDPIKAADFERQFDKAFGIRHSAAWDQFSQSTPLHSQVLPRRFA